MPGPQLRTRRGKGATGNIDKLQPLATQSNETGTKFSTTVHAMAGAWFVKYKLNIWRPISKALINQCIFAKSSVYFPPRSMLIEY